MPPRDRVEPIPSHDALRVVVLVGPGEVAQTVVRALLAGALHACSADDLARDGRGAAAVVCGWPGLAFAEQRRRTRETVERHIAHRNVLITDLARRAPLQRFLADGIHGLVLQAQLHTALCPTIRAVAAGQLCVPTSIRQAIERRPLSLREREVLALVIMGQSNGEIARRLHIAESTVKSHLVSTFAKLGVRSRAEAAQVVSDPQRMLATGVIGLSTQAADDENGQPPEA